MICKPLFIPHFLPLLDIISTKKLTVLNLDFDTVDTELKFRSLQQEFILCFSGATTCHSVILVVQGPQRVWDPKTVSALPSWSSNLLQKVHLKIVPQIIKTVEVILLAIVVQLLNKSAKAIKFYINSMITHSLAIICTLAVVVNSPLLLEVFMSTGSYLLLFIKEQDIF